MDKPADAGRGRLLVRRPGRGRWDRSVPGDRRHEIHRRRLLDATRAAVAAGGGPATATQVVGLAGVGRNTFYEHFENVEDAVGAAYRETLDEIRQAIEDAVGDARTPIEGLRALTTAWLAAAPRHSGALLAALSGGDRERGARAALRHDLEDQLWSVLASARAAGAVGIRVEPVRLACIAGAFERAAADVADDGETDVARVAETLVDVTLRAFR
jgi:AcrR family transcriptional regulator